MEAAGGGGLGGHSSSSSSSSGGGHSPPCLLAKRGREEVLAIHGADLQAEIGEEEGGEQEEDVNVGQVSGKKKWEMIDRVDLNEHFESFFVVGERFGLTSV